MLESLASGFLDKRIALDYLLVLQWPTHCGLGPGRCNNNKKFVSSLFFI